MAVSKGILNWVTGAIATAIDSAKEERVESHVARVDAEFTRLRDKFDFDRAVIDLGISGADRQLVAARVYRRFLVRSWKDLQLSARESEMLVWVARTLGLDPAATRQLNAEAACDVFRHTLASVIADGQVDEAEATRLQAISAHAGQSVGQLMQMFFSQEGDSLLRSIFSQAAADGRLEREEWKHFRQTVERLGIPKEQMLRAIRQPAHQLVEHVLADARSDGHISEREEKTLVSLVDNTIDDVEYATYVRDQIDEAREMANLAKGILPSLTPPSGVALRSGEIVHWAGPVTYVRTRESASGAKTQEVEGDAVVTDARMIFNAMEKSFDVGHRRVIAHFPFANELEVRASGKGAGRYIFDRNGHRAIAIWQVAIGRANQTIVASDESQRSRHISREVRQRVWQRCGGRCVECNADTYLEFDHIIPVAKGGGNSETNVQLLCRKCNLAKSDRI